MKIESVAKRNDTVIVKLDSEAANFVADALREWGRKELNLISARHRWKFTLGLNDYDERLSVNNAMTLMERANRIKKYSSEEEQT